MIGVVSMKRKILAFVTAAAVMCSSGMVVSADPAYDTDYRITIEVLGKPYVSTPTIYKMAGKTRAWIMQYSISGKPDNTITNIFVSTPQGVKLTGDQSIVKDSNIFPGYGSNAGYQGGTRLQANGTYTAGYTITGTWNPNID